MVCHSCSNVVTQGIGNVFLFVFFQVQKLSALGYMPLLFLSRRHKGTGKLKADVITHLPSTQKTKTFISTMMKAYTFMISGKCFMQSSLVFCIDFSDKVYKIYIIC